MSEWRWRRTTLHLLGGGSRALLRRLGVLRLWNGDSCPVIFLVRNKRFT
jgi:hypothetical protein